MPKYFRYRRAAAGALVMGALAAQTREHNMQPMFYPSSAKATSAPAPVAIRQGSASPLPAARPMGLTYTLRAWGNAERNSRLPYQVKPLAEHPKWQVDLPAHFDAEHVLAGGGRIVVEGPDGWLLLDGSGRILQRDRRSEGEITVDPLHGVFYAPTPVGYVGAYSLMDGRREFFVTALFGSEYRRALIERRQRRMLIVSVQRPTDPHATVEANRSVIELQDLGEPLQYGDERWLKSAKRVDYLKGATADVLTALHRDTLVLAVDDGLYVADFNLKLQRQLTGQFQPLFLSLDESGRVYLIVRIESGLELWVLTLAGERLMRVPMPNGFEPATPPVVGFDHSIYLAGQHRVLALDPAGAVRWDHSADAEIAGVAITPAGDLVVAAGPELFSYDQAGQRTRLFLTDGDVLATPPAVNERGELLVAGKRRLYCVP
jgi:hypothetical protein